MEITIKLKPESISIQNLSINDCFVPDFPSGHCLCNALFMRISSHGVGKAEQNQIPAINLVTGFIEHFDCDTLVFPMKVTVTAEYDDGR